MIPVGRLSILVVRLLFFSSIVVGEYDESVDDGGETTVFFDCRWFPFCLTGLDGKILFDEREGTGKDKVNSSNHKTENLRFPPTGLILMPADLHHPTGKISREK